MTPRSSTKEKKNSKKHKYEPHEVTVKMILVLLQTRPRRLTLSQSLLLLQPYHQSLDITKS